MSSQSPDRSWTRGAAIVAASRPRGCCRVPCIAVVSASQGVGCLRTPLNGASLTAPANSLSSTVALVEGGTSGFSWCNNVRRSAITFTATMNGVGDEASRGGCARPEAVSADCCHANVCQVPGAVARSPPDDRAPAPHHELADGAPSRHGSRLLRASGGVTATLVCLGAGPPGAGLSAARWGAAGACPTGRR